MNRRFTSFRKTKAVCQSRVTLKTTVFFFVTCIIAHRARTLIPRAQSFNHQLCHTNLNAIKACLGTRLFTWLLNRWSKVKTGALDYVIVLNLLPKVLSLRLRTLGTKLMVAITSTIFRCHGSRYCCDINKRFYRIFTPPIRNNFLVYFTGNSSKWQIISNRDLRSQFLTVWPCLFFFFSFFFDTSVSMIMHFQHTLTRISFFTCIVKIR